MVQGAWHADCKGSGAMSHLTDFLAPDLAARGRTRVAARSPDGTAAILEIDGFEFRVEKHGANDSLDVYEPGTSASHALAVTPPRHDPLIPETVAVNSWGLVTSREPSRYASAREIPKHNNAMRLLATTVCAIARELGVFRSA